MDMLDTSPSLVTNSTSSSYGGGTKPNALIEGLSITLLILALAYSLADFSIILDINEFSNEWKNPGWFALKYSVAYFRVLFQSIIILLFIFIFIVIYDIVLIGFIRPILSDSVDSQKNISSFAGASDIITATKEGYFASITAVMQHVIKIVFGFVQIKYAIVLLMAIVPSFIFGISYTYYAFLCSKEMIKKEDLQKVLKTNFHFISLIVICLIVVVLAFLVYNTIV